MKRPVNLIRPRWYKSHRPNLRVICFLLYGLFLFFISLFLVNPQWDEYLDFSGCVGAANHLLSALRGNLTDISTITSDLEWYGNSFRWPAYLLWSLQKGFPVQIQGGPQSYDHFLRSGFSSSMHLIAVAYSLLGVFIYSQIIAKLSPSRFIGWASIFCLCLSPFWLSNATWNLKDLPVAVCVLIVEFFALAPSESCQSSLGSESRRSWMVSVIFALILASKYAYLPLVVLLSFLYVLSRFLSIYIVDSPSVSLDISLLPWRTTAFIVSRNAFFQILSSFVLSFAFTPQILGNPYYPLHAFEYFIRHPVVSVSRAQAISFFASRFSYLVTPAFLVFALVSCSGLWILIFKRRASSSYLLIGLAGVRKATVCAFFLFPALFFVAPVLVSGRAFYGPDLRHVIWIYPPFLLCLTIFADYARCNLSSSLRIFLRLLLTLSVIISFIELLMITPHFYSYLGVAPFHAGQGDVERSLLLSRYSPGRAPELHRDMFLSCARDSSCSSGLALLLPGTDSNYYARLSFPINPDYYNAYLRLRGWTAAPILFSSFGYSLSVHRSDVCSTIDYGRDWPVRLFSSLEICPEDITKDAR